MSTLESRIKEQWNLPVGYERLTGTPSKWATALEIDLSTASDRIIQTGPEQSELPPIVLASASETIHAYQAEIDFIKRQGTGIGIDPAIAARDASTAQPGAIIVGRSQPWQNAVLARKDIIPINIGRKPLYYTSEALIATARENPEIFNLVIQRLKEEPQTPIHIYTLDEPMQIFLLWLQKEADISAIYINANTQEIAKSWNSKHILYPAITSLGNPGLLQGVCENALPLLPGLYIRDLQQFLDNNELQQAALEYMQTNSVSTVCIKPTRGTDGSMISREINVADNLEELLTELRDNYLEQHREVVIEPFIDYQTIKINDMELPLALSAHIMDGQATSGITLQLMGDGGEWRGNVSLSQESAAEIGIDQAQYQTILSTMEDIARSLRPIGLIKGGIDWAIGSIDHRHNTICTLTDPNLRANGGEILQRYWERKKTELGDTIQVATRVIKPRSGVSHQQVAQSLQEAIDIGVLEENSADVIAVVPPGWGMIGVTADRSLDALQNAFAAEEYLRSQDLVA